MKYGVVVALRGLGAICLMGGAAASAPVAGQALGAPVTNLLARASDDALDKLAKPGAFYADEAVRILLPGPLGKASGLMRLTDQAGLTNGLTKSLNDAAGLAAQEAKPIFRNAIRGMSLRDGVGIATKGDGATRYLQESAGSELRIKIRPLIVSALDKVGAFGQLGKLTGGRNNLLSGAGFSRDGLTDSVTDQALSGIFKYIGSEEAKVRANPLGVGEKALRGLKWNG